MKPLQKCLETCIICDGHQRAIAGEGEAHTYNKDLRSYSSLCENSFLTQLLTHFAKSSSHRRKFCLKIPLNKKKKAVCFWRCGYLVTGRSNASFPLVPTRLAFKVSIRWCTWYQVRKCDVKRLQAPDWPVNDGITWWVTKVTLSGKGRKKKEKKKNCHFWNSATR